MKGRSRLEKLEWALLVKERANELYWALDFKEAALMYTDCLVALDFTAGKEANGAAVAANGGEKPSTVTIEEVEEEEANPNSRGLLTPGAISEAGVDSLDLRMRHEVQLPVTANLAACLLEIGQYARVIEMCDITLAIDPRHAKALMRRGIARYRQGSDTRVAREDFEKGLQVLAEERLKLGEDAMEGVVAAAEEDSDEEDPMELEDEEESTLNLDAECGGVRLRKRDAEGQTAVRKSVSFAKSEGAGKSKKAPAEKSSAPRDEGFSRFKTEQDIRRVEHRIQVYLLMLRRGVQQSRKVHRRMLIGGGEEESASEAESEAASEAGEKTDKTPDGQGTTDDASTAGGSEEDTQSKKGAPKDAGASEKAESKTLDKPKSESTSTTKPSSESTKKPSKKSKVVRHYADRDSKRDAAPKAAVDDSDAAIEAVLKRYTNYSKETVGEKFWRVCVVGWLWEGTRLAAGVEWCRRRHGESKTDAAGSEDPLVRTASGSVKRVAFVAGEWGRE